MIETRGRAMLRGLRDGLPIGLGYLAVAFSLGIQAKNLGMTPFQGFLVSLLCNASAGEYAGFTAIAGNAALAELALVMLVANARYLLMSAALSQKLREDLPFFHRLLIAFDVTDEIFGLAVAQPGFLNPFYLYGTFILPLAGWSSGTALGIVMGSLLPARVVSALSVALYGMFIAVIIPPARGSRVVLGLVLLSFGLSWLCGAVPLLSGLTGSAKVILLTLVLAGAAGVLFPVREEGEGHAA